MAVTQHPITEFDTFFISYDEPNADRHWADLLDKAPWAERVHGVKGFAAAHEEAARRSQTDWFVTVDADNIVMPEFFNVEVSLDRENNPNRSYTWNGMNMMNGLIYGNGGVKLWSKPFVLNGGVGHEHATDPRNAVEFCWQPDYVTIPEVYSEVWNNGSAYQAWRVGFREGVKLTLDRGERVPAREMSRRLHPMNLRNIRIWCCVGADVEHGKWAMLGARMGWAAMLDPEWDHTVVSDFDTLQGIYASISPTRMLGDDHVASNIMHSGLKGYGNDITAATGIKLPIMDNDTSDFFRETFKLRNQ